MRKSKKSRRAVPLRSASLGSIASPLRAHNPGVDLGSLQGDFVTTKRDLKSAATKLANAQEAFDAARTRHSNASEKLKAASRAVLAEV